MFQEKKINRCHSLHLFFLGGLKIIFKFLSLPKLGNLKRDKTPVKKMDTARIFWQFARIFWQLEKLFQIVVCPTPSEGNDHAF